VLDESDVARPTAHYPPADITPAEFEEFVVQLLGAVAPGIDHLVVTLHDKVTAADGTHDFDATVRFMVAGMQFLVIVEAKRHKNPVKRELVQVLHQKVLSVGAHKGLMVSTAPYQRGALEFAVAHGIALATVTEGRFTVEVRGAGRRPEPMTREEAQQRGIPIFVGHHYYGIPDKPGSVGVSLLSTEYPDHVVRMLTDQTGSSD
jgi:hypothetical protein